MIKYEFEAIGTHWIIDIAKELSSEEEALLLEKIMNRIGEFDLVYSRFRQDSIVMKMSRESGEFVLPDDADTMISLYKKMYDITGGLVTPLIGKTLVEAGYDDKYSLKQGELSSISKWEDVIEWSTPRITIKQPTILDFGAGGKGYLVDIVSEILEKNNIDVYCVDAGGDMRSRGGKPIRVGLEHPEDTTKVIGVALLKNQSICGSAGNRRAWGDFHHIISPETLSSPRHILAVWVTANTTMLADLLTTGLFFVSGEKLLKYFDFEYLIVKSDYSIERSSGFDAEIFN